MITDRFRLHSPTLAALTTLVAIAGQPAFAATAQDSPLTMTVSYADLDLSHVAGVQVAYRRLRLAAEQVCEPLESPDRVREQAYHACIQKAFRAAVAKVNKPLLTQYFQSTEGIVSNPSVALAR